MSGERPAVKRPDFLIIGGMKCGTASLYRYVKNHPQVFLATPDEVQFFNRPSWEQQLPWYEALFADCGDALVVGERSTNYAKHPLIPDVPARIAKLMPEVRLIYIVRDPIERARSHFMHEVIRGRERRAIDDALFEKEDYLAFSKYAMQIEQYLAHFDLDQMLVIRSEALKGARVDTMKSVYRFLGVDDSWVPTNVNVEFHRTSDRRELRPWAHRARRSRVYKRLRPVVPERVRHGILRTFHDSLTWKVDPTRGTMSDELRAEVALRLRDDVRRLRTYLDHDFDGWGIG